MRPRLRFAHSSLVSSHIALRTWRVKHDLDANSSLTRSLSPRKAHVLLGFAALIKPAGPSLSSRTNRSSASLKPWQQILAGRRAPPSSVLPPPSSLDSRAALTQTRTLTALRACIFAQRQTAKTRERRF